jgi:hypothetical protein
MGPKHTPSDWTFWLSVALVFAIMSALVYIPAAITVWIAAIGVWVVGCTLLQALIRRQL